MQSLPLYQEPNPLVDNFHYLVADMLKKYELTFLSKQLLKGNLRLKEAIKILEKLSYYRKKMGKDDLNVSGELDLYGLTCIGGFKESR